jgi:hypothetical protein
MSQTNVSAHRAAYEAIVPSSDRRATHERQPWIVRTVEGACVITIDLERICCQLTFTTTLFIQNFFISSMDVARQFEATTAQIFLMWLFVPHFEVGTKGTRSSGTAVSWPTNCLRGGAQETADQESHFMQSLPRILMENLNSFKFFTKIWWLTKFCGRLCLAVNIRSCYINAW